MQVDAKQSSGETHRILIYALLASLLAHLFGLLYFQSKTTLVVSFPANPYPSSFNVTFSTFQAFQTTDTNITDTPKATPKLEVSSKEPLSLLPPTGEPRLRAPNNTVTSTLKIPSSAVEIRRFLQELPEEPSGQTTVNGAIVMNQAVRIALQQNPGIKNFSAATDDLLRSATYDAGSWTEWVQFGDNCFQVKRANPLEPYSNEIWYRTACH